MTPTGFELNEVSKSIIHPLVFPMGISFVNMKNILCPLNQRIMKRTISQKHIDQLIEEPTIDAYGEDEQ